MPDIDPTKPVNLEEWIPHFPIETLKKRGYRSIVYSDIEHICLVDQVRPIVIGGNGGSLQQWPMDMLVLARGDPEARDVSKFGGLPYRPRDLSWPVSPESGKPMTFVAQLRFTESFDILGPLPGDVLLVFFEELHKYSPTHFEWHNLGMSDSDLVTASEVPATWITPSTAGKIPEYYGVRCRYSDIVDDGVIDALWECLLEQRPKGKWSFPEWEECETERRNALRAWLCQLCCFKIGGGSRRAACWIASCSWASPMHRSRQSAS
jgi:hypothetical protein